ncbi:hypothetical protein B4U80_12998 [Leptotrombidium deliense]|uniref:C2H2-type domain-containing protein n=1 Tax=Leptotrombidium deliense TaxID=299467 RepID=A0A443SFA0_9ACAR|nr:hypothetical protein B4U80_12998 [Leptotrombidium deliense]
MKFEHLKVLIDSIYYGKLKIPKDQFPELLKSAQSLGFTHLCNTDSWNFTTMSEKQEESSMNLKIDVSKKVVDGVSEKNANDNKVHSDALNSHNAKESIVHERSSQHSHNVEVVTPVHAKSAPCVQSTVGKPLANVAPNQVPTKPNMPQKAVGPQLFSEANSILSRCLELISKPVANVTQSVPVSTSAPSNSGGRSCAPIDSNYCALPVHMNHGNSYVNYNVGKGIEAQYPRVFDERIRAAEQMSKMHAHQFMANKPIAMSYPKSFAKPEVTDAMSAAAATWRYNQQYPHSVGSQRPRLLTPISLASNQKEELNPQLRNYVSHPNAEAMRAASLRHRTPVPKPNSDYHSNFAQNYTTYDHKLPYAKNMTTEIRHYPPITSKYDNSNSIRRNSMSYVESRSQYHSSPVDQDSTLLSQALVVPHEQRRTLSNASERHLTRDPFQALIVAKAAIKKKQDDEDGSEKSVVVENHSNNSRPCSTNSNSSNSNSISVERTERQSSTETQTKSAACFDERKEEKEKEAEPQNENCASRNSNDARERPTPDKLMQVVEECDLFIEEDAYDEDIEGDYYDETDIDGKVDGVKQGGTDDRPAFQPPFKKRKSSGSDPKIAKCEECGKVVSCIYYLQEHIRVKHKKQNLVCSELGCDFAVLDRTKFNNHLIETHGKVRRRGRNKE